MWRAAIGTVEEAAFASRSMVARTGTFLETDQPFDDAALPVETWIVNERHYS